MFNCTFRTCESSLGMTSTMTAKGHRFLGASMSFRRTTSPSFRSGCIGCHLRRSYSICMYSSFYLVQNLSAKTWTLFHYERIMSFEVKFSKYGNSELSLNFCVRMVLGESTEGFSGSLDTASSGRWLTIAVTSVISVQNTSCVRCWLTGSDKIALKILLTMPIRRSHDPPKCGACGGIRIHFVPTLSKNSHKALFSTLIQSTRRSYIAPTKFVPLSERKILTLPRIAMNRRNAFINADEILEFTASMWTALVTKQVNIIPRRFDLAIPPRILRETTCQGLKAFNSYIWERWSRLESVSW